MRSKKTKLPLVVLDVANIGSRSNLKDKFPSLVKHLLKGKVMTASGGSKFKKELFQAFTLLGLFNELNNINMIVKIEDSIADDEVNRFLNLIENEFGKRIQECDDPHLFALLKLLNEKTVISFDTRMSKCKNCLRKSNINNNEFANAKRLGNDAQYLSCYNSKSL